MLAGYGEALRYRIRCLWLSQSTEWRTRACIASSNISLIYVHWHLWPQNRQAKVPNKRPRLVVPEVKKHWNFTKRRYEEIRTAWPLHIFCYLLQFLLISLAWGALPRSEQSLLITHLLFSGLVCGKFLFSKAAFERMSQAVPSYLSILQTCSEMCNACKQ